MRYVVALLIAASMIGGFFIFAHVMSLKMDEYVSQGLVLTPRMRMLFSISTFWWNFRELLIPVFVVIPLGIAVLTGIRKRPAAADRKSS